MLPLSLNLVREKLLTLSDLVRKLSLNPSRIIGKSNIGTLMPGSRANVTVFDPDEEFVLTADVIKSKSKNTPFLNKRMRGKVKLTIYNGKIVYED